MDSFFRTQAVDARRKSEWLGPILVSRPISTWTWAALGIFVSCVIAAILVFGTYRHRETVQGQIVATGGIENLLSPINGTVVKVFAKDGDHVHRGQQIVEILSEQTSTTYGETKALVSETLSTQQQKLHATIAGERLSSENKRKALTKKKDNLVRQLALVDDQVDIQQKQISSYQKLLPGMLALEKKGYISSLQVEQQNEAVFTAQAQAKSLLRDKASMEQDLADTNQSLDAIDVDLNLRVNDLSRTMAGISQQQIENEGARRVVLRSSSDGVISTLSFVEGQSVNATQQVATIVPANSRLQARVLVPTHAAGFLKKDGSVNVRYDAFPYQKFGQYKATIANISAASLDGADSASPDTSVKGESEPVYRVDLDLERADVSAYGILHPLKPGMTLKADLLLDNRSLLEWMFEPLLGVKRRQTTEFDK
jgi:membrane fusion protein